MQRRIHHTAHHWFFHLSGEINRFDWVAFVMRVVYIYVHARTVGLWTFGTQAPDCDGTSSHRALALMADQFLTVEYAELLFDSGY